MVSEAFGTFAFTLQGIEYMILNRTLQPYKTLVRLHLEYCGQFWPLLLERCRSTGKSAKKRTCGYWNKLPEEVVQMGTITTFNRHLDKYMDKEGLGQAQASETSPVRQLGWQG